MHVVTPLIIPVYAPEGQPKAESLCRDLQEAGLPVCFPEVGLDPSCECNEEIRNHGAFGLVIWTKDTTYALPMRFAFLQIRSADIPLICVLFEGAALPDYLIAQEMFDLVLDGEKPSLMKRIRVIYDYFTVDNPLWKLRPGSAARGFSLFRFLPFENEEAPNPRNPDFHVLLGTEQDRDPYFLDFRVIDHLLVYGPRGSGRHDYVRCLLATLLRVNGSRVFQIALSDPQDSIERADMLWCLRGKVARTQQQRWDLIYDLEEEAHNRLNAFVESGHKTIEEFNEASKDVIYPHIFVVVDDYEHSQCEDGIRVVAEVGRNLGIHFIAVGERTSNEFDFPTKVRFKAKHDLIFLSRRGETIPMYAPMVTDAKLDDMMLEHTPITFLVDKPKYEKMITFARTKEFLTALDLKNEFGLTPKQASKALYELQGYEVVADYVIPGKGYPVLPPAGDE